MLEHIYYFIKGISSIKYEVPIYMKIAAFLALGVLATCIVLIFGENLDKSIFKDSYMIYYVIFIVNIINIIVILYYYKKKSGTFIGEQGISGNKGLKGKTGTNIDCSLCTHNLYMKKTETYDTICRLDTNKYLIRILGETEDTTLNNLIANNNFNYEQFATSLLVDGFDMNNPSVLKIFNYINAFEFLLYNNINSAIGSSNSSVTGYFRRPDVALGNYCLGDTVMGGSEEYNITTYGINGDIILPDGFMQICTFTTITEKGNTEKFGIYKIIPPEWSVLIQTDLPPEERNLEKQPKKDEYLSLGHVIAPITNSKSPDKELFACIKKSCCKKMNKGSLKLMFIYPAVNLSGNSNNNENIEEDIMGMFSVWRTPLNTLYVKYMDSSKIVDGHTIVEQLYLNMDNNEIQSELYTRYGTIKKVIKERVKSFLNKIILDKITILGILFNHTFEKVSKLLKEYYSKFIGGGTMELPNSNLLKDLLSKNSTKSISYNDIHILINEIDKNINTKKKNILKEEQARLAQIKKKRILGLGQLDGNGENNKNEVSYNALKQYQQIKTTIAELSVNVENSTTLLDVVNSIYDGGINFILDINDLTYAQKIILYASTCLIKPNEDIWIIKNKCLVYEQLDENRIALQNNVADIIKRFNYLRKKIDNKAEDQCGLKDLNKINKAVEDTYERLMKNIGHIPNVLEKLNKLNTEIFTDNQLTFIYGEMNKLVIYIENKCS
jgi:hypothetical protein